MAENISKIFNKYVAGQKSLLNPRNLAYCDDAVGLFEACLNSYGHLHIDEEENKLLDESELEFCEFFSPEILDYGHFSEYLGYFLPKKVLSGYYTINKYKIQILRLIDWLYEQKYCFQDEKDIKGIKSELREDFKYWWQECNKPIDEDF